MRKRVIICCNVYPPRFVGGAELIAHYQAKSLQQQGHEVIIFAGDIQPGHERHSLQKDCYEGLSVYRVALHPVDYQIDQLDFFHPQVEHHFDTVLAQFSPDVAHFHNLIGLSVGLIHRAKRRGITTVLTVHDHWGFCHKNTLLKTESAICQDYTQCAQCQPFIQAGIEQSIPIRFRRDFLALQLSEIDTFISPSQYLADAYIRAGFPAERFRVIWYGIDVERFAKITKIADPGRVRFSFIGYLGKHKGVHTLLDALPLLREKTGVTINLVGEGMERATYEKRVRELGWERAVRFWGRVDNRQIERVYQETDVLVLPSIWPENQPVSITEAMAARIPVIASRIGGIPELIEDARTGYLFSAGNAAELAEKMSVFVTDRVQLGRFGENAFRQMAGNTLASQTGKILKVYDAERRFSKKVKDELLIVCVGKRIPTAHAQALQDFLQARLPQWRVVMNEWVQEEQMQRAKVLWVLDGEADEQTVFRSLRHQVPLLVPQNNRALKDLCVHGKCGLYYRDSAEAYEFLEYLTGNPPMSAALGQNGFQLLHSPQA